MCTVLVTGGAGFIGSHVADALIAPRPRRDRPRRPERRLQDNVPPGARFVQGSVTDPALVDRALRAVGFDYVYPPRGLCRRRAEPLHQAVQLHEQRHRQRQPDQRGGQHRRQGLRVRLLDRGVRRAPELPMTEETRPRRRIRTASPSSPSSRSSRACREMFGLDYIDLPAAQRLRSAAEHRGPLPQRRRHLHEPDPAGQADDDLRRRHADPRVQLHRRRRAGHGRGNRRRGALGRDVQHRRGHAVHAERLAAAVARAMGVEPRDRAPAGAARSRTCASRRTTKIWQGVRRRAATTTLEDGLARDGRLGHASTAPATTPPFQGIEIMQNLPAAWQRRREPRHRIPRRAPAGGLRRGLSCGR